MRRIVLAALLVITVNLAARADLMQYVARADPTYAWKKVQDGQIDGLTYADLRMTSQTWHDIEWKHRLVIVRPESAAHATQAVLVIAGGSWHEGQEPPPVDEKSREFQMAKTIANAARCPVAFILQIPFQPIFDGKVEDQIISYTFEQYIKTGDEDWPLLFPMAKAAVRAMDTVQAYADKEWQLKIKDFVVCGASKRGWTTWLTGAIDPRVKAIAPMVIDTLNMPAQMKHQVETWGTYSEQIGDYTRAGIQGMMDTPAGQKLTALVDPYSYRRKLTMPKLLIMGTNDRYWPLDALNIYWPDLEGEKYVLYIPNVGHDLKDPLRLLSDISAWSLKAAGQLKFPRLSWDLAEKDSGLELKVRSDVKPVSVSLWTAESDTRDFRPVKWKSRELNATGDEFVGVLDRPQSGFSAAFGEAYYQLDGHPLYLSTNVRIIEAKK